MSNFSPIELQPGADMDMIIQAINDNFRQQASENRANIITDETGNKRILLGRTPGGNYGLYITKPGKDVLTELGY